jgi:ribonuclease E
MTDADDKLSRRYREGARDEPPAHVDAAILAASRRAVGAGPRARKSNWMVPTSIAAVLVLGIGVSLRMQMEKPGIETSTPGGSAEYPLPSAEPPPPAPARAEPLADRGRDASVESQDASRKPDAALKQRAAVPAEEGKREAPKALAKEQAPRAETPTAKLSAADSLRKDEPNPFGEAPVAMQPAVPASPPAVALSLPAATPAPPAPAPAQPKAFAQAEQAAPVPQAAPAPAMRAKREALANDSAGPRESRALAAVADPDPVRELERIARLREAGRHPEADRALEEFRRRHADFRIPDATWQRVKPR